MSAPAIKAENIGKQYKLGMREKGDRSFREAVTDCLTAPLRRLRHLSEKPADDTLFWALRDVSFEVQPGEVVGIIGRNGAGKSTLLKILSRITEPTVGQATIRGRVRSLLEVGTGFHGELTGRENIYLNGAILGMKKAEIERKFDEIVAFADVEKFLDTPVKRYSSGMYVRLAFAVAAHLEPEILLIDEVLAVGDVAFQKKCLGKMGEVASQGRTVLFVSHNMIAIKSLCSRALQLSQGRLVAEGPTAQVVSAYLNEGRISRAECIWNDPAAAPGNHLFRLRGARVRGKDGNVVSEMDARHAFALEFDYWNLEPRLRIGTTAVVYNEDGICVFGSISNQERAWHGRPRPVGLFRSTCRIPGDLLPAGRFHVSVLLWADNYACAHREDHVLEFDVYEAGGARGDYLGGMDGVIRPLLPWQTELLTPDPHDAADDARSHAATQESAQCRN